MLPFIDLKYQYSLIRDEIHAGIDRVLESGHYILGAEIAELEKQLAEYAGVKHALACSSGTDALLMALMALGIGPGDAVFTTPFTFFATVETIALVGATPVFADIDEATYNIDPAKLEEAILKVEREGKLKPKAVIPVDLFGLTADYKAIKPLADAHGLAIIEDACQAFGAVDPSGKRAPSLGTIGCTSFFPSKNLGCYEDGGAIFTNDDDLAARMRAIANHGMVVRYHHDMIGVNSRLDSIQAAVLDAKLPHLDEYIAARQRAAAYYDEAFGGNDKILIPGHEAHSTHVYHQYTLRVVGADRDKLREGLAERGIPAMIYYPVPLHQQKAYLDPRYKDGDFPVAEKLAACVLSLPMHTELDDEQLASITTSVLELIG